MNKELDIIMKNRPNIWGNSIGMLLIRILAWVGAILCFAAGIYFLTLSTTNSSDNSFFEGLYYKDSNPIFAAFCLLLSLLLFFIVRMGRMLLVRNSFILDVKEWNDEFKKLEMREGEIA